MIDTPQITEITAQLAATIHLSIPRSEIRSAMGVGIAEVMAAVKAQGIGPAGPLFTHHLKMDPATFDFEICGPVTAPLAPVGRVKPGLFKRQEWRAPPTMEPMKVLAKPGVNSRLGSRRMGMPRVQTSMNAT